jgi:uncharacterized protein YjcR
MPGGRPTLYDPDYCEDARTFLADGFSVAALAGKLKVAVSTVNLWIDKHPEFSDAVKEGQAGAVYWWEQRNRELAQGGSGNATTVIFGLKNRAPDQWKDKLALTGGDESDAPIKQSLTVTFV